ncbi:MULTISPECIES: sulfurtransferase complex subunit TusD [unclassified Vibrio]|uniref:Sulfurtransferase TusD homolog n=1 Tax=Vibrio sp. HB236076 TaxID=3232307 RepID=A0AB39HAC6_9VIBR|nr:sulfurtransferase complex subunit TusD [Vibrio sp. HB161653]MDP5255336.1 sulfurtransferase complex subunit TusD [Vibrio sp. HB161653]
MVALNYTLVVNGPIYGKQASFSAYQFAQALLNKGHALNKVFFYQEGVTNALATVSPANDELNLTQAWQNLALQHGFGLEACISASLRRGVLDQQEAQKAGHGTVLAKGFELAGLGSLATSLLQDDRVVQF